MSRLVSLARRWGFAVVWVTLPFTAGPAFADALDPRMGSVRLVAGIGLWAIWAVALVAGLAASTVSLTAIRVAAPASVAAAGWAALATPDGAGVADAVALGVTAVASVVALSGAVGDEFVNASSYGEERRLPLRPPGPLLLGPIELTWAVLVVGAVAGPMLLAAHVWVVGAVVLVVGWAAAVLCARALHQLARRWLVLVPAGIVVVDHTTLADSMLVTRPLLASIGPAPAGSTATDLTAGALGLALELRTTEPLVIVPAPPRVGTKAVTPVEVEAVLVAPTRPGVALTEASRRRFTIA